MTQTDYSPIVAVAGATGAQGGATARALLRAGRPVRALTRRPDSDAAAELRRLGAQIAFADFADRPSLDAALAGTGSLFAVGAPFGSDVEIEVVHGVALLEAAAATGTVEHIVFTSAANVDRDTGVPHFESKRRIEHRLQTLGVPWTVIAPAAFMDQYTEEWTLRGLRRGVFGRPMPGTVPLPLICTADIGAFATLALTRPDHFAGRRIDIAADTRTGHEIAAALGAACGSDIRYEEIPVAQIEAHSPDLAAMFRYFVETGLDVDVPGLRHDHPEVEWLRLPEWAAAQSWDGTSPTTAPTSRRT